VRPSSRGPLVARAQTTVPSTRECLPALLVTIACWSAGLGPIPASARATAVQIPAGDDGQWTMPAKDYSATRYSGLAQITARNAGSLHPVWTFSTGVLGGHEGQPLVVNHTMYVVTPWPNTLYAFNLAEEGYPLRWKYRPDVSPNAIGIACCDSVNRGAFFAAGKIIYNLLDGQTVAVDANSGKEVWKTRIAEVRSGETITMAPLVANDRVLTGASGGEFGIYGWMKALDLSSGAVVWSARNLGPDAAMLVRPGAFEPIYDSGPELGSRSWPADAWKIGGAPVWGWISYDPQLDLIFYGTGNAAPFNPAQRPGDNKWTCSVLARRPADGTLVWAYQFTPHDSWDYDATGAMILADVTVAGRQVKALVHFDKNGFAYTLDRATGRVLVAAAFAPVTWAKSVDLTTGRPVLEPAEPTSDARGAAPVICPSLEGAVSPSSPAAYSPRLRLFFTSTNNFCMHHTPSRATYLKATPYQSSDSSYISGPGGHLGSFIAWDAAIGRKVWENKEPFPSWSGALVTAGDVVFYGTLDGWFKSVDARTGKLLSRFKVGSGVIGNPITFRGPDGKQYVAVYAGFGGDWSLIAGDTRSDDPADVRLPANFVRNIARHTSQGGSVWIFGL
jgi:PQQ-dependent dehydrogenase (methanol/ethanol family)